MDNSFWPNSEIFDDERYQGEDIDRPITDAEYIESLCDGRNVWSYGERLRMSHYKIIFTSKRPHFQRSWTEHLSLHSIGSFRCCQLSWIGIYWTIQRCQEGNDFVDLLLYQMQGFQCVVKIILCEERSTVAVSAVYLAE